MKTNGFISLHRSLLTWEWHNNPTMLTVWTHLLLLAEYEETEYNGRTICRGQLIASQQWLAAFMGISYKQLRLCLEKLEEGKYISKKRASSQTLITICQFNDFQTITNAAKKAETTVKATKGKEKGQEKGNIGINNNKYNNKNLSDGEIKTPSTSAKTANTPQPAKTANTPQPAPVPEASASGPASQLRTYAAALWQNTAWLNLCCKTYTLPLAQVQRYAIAFYEQMRTEQPNKTWLSNDDFCRHFLSWLKFQTPQKVVKYLNSFRAQKQRQLWRKAEDERQAEMWREVEETKKKAISYEEYLRRKEEKSPLPPEREFTSPASART